jgi:hypothetical protein
MASVLLSSCSTPSRRAVAQRRTAFIALNDFSNFTQSPGAAPDEVVLTSPEIKAPIDWDELVVSWNVSDGAWLKVEACGIYPDRATKFYTLGFWSEDPALHPRESVLRQRNGDGTVKTDTLVLTRPCSKLRPLLLQQSDAARRR